MSDPGGAPAGPLQGIRVLDLTRYLAGPYCTMLLGDMGAEVVKLEPPGGGRDFGSGAGGHANYFFLSVNRSKRSATLDLQSPEGREAFLRLVDRVDVVVENFRPAVMAELGIGAAACAPAIRAWSTATSRVSAPPGRTRSAPASIRSRRACRA